MNCKSITLIAVLIAYKTILLAQLSGHYPIGATEPFPYNTIKSAITHLNSVGVSNAVTFLLTDPLYEESHIEFITVSGTSAHNTITLRPANNVHATIRGKGEFVIGIDRTSYLTFNGKSADGSGSLTITSSETNIGSSCIKLTTPDNTVGNIQELHITNCIINAAPPSFALTLKHYKSGIYLQTLSMQTNKITITNNLFYGGDRSISYGTNKYFESVDISNNQFISAGGISLIVGGPGGELLTVDSNHFSNTNLATTLHSFSVIDVVHVKQLVLTNNTFDKINYDFTNTNRDCKLFNIQNVTNSLISNNVVKNMLYNAPISPVPGIELGTFLHIFSIARSGVVNFYHNSIYIPRSDNKGFRSKEAFIIGLDLRTNQQIDIRNNIFALLQGNQLNTTVNSFASIYQFNSSDDISHFNIDNNIYYVANHTNNYFYCYDDYRTFYSIEQWKEKQVLLDQNSSWEKPFFISENNLQLSQECNRGVPITQVTKDIKGVLRNTLTPDIGAYESNNVPKIMFDTNCENSSVHFYLSNSEQVLLAYWTFGDGNTSVQASTSHVYSRAGKYTVTVELTYKDNKTETYNQEVEITPKLKPLRIIPVN